MKSELDRPQDEASGDGACGLAQALEQIGALLCGLQYGELRIVVQDRVIVQIDCTEKRRLRRPCRVSESPSPRG